MENMYSVIDIGSNSVRYLGRGKAKRLITTRLAEGLLNTGRLSDEAIARSVRAVAEFAALSREEGLIPRAYATSAVRDAENSYAFTSAVLEATGIEVDVISGEDEARYALLGANCVGGGLIGIVGGSSQLVAEDFSASFPMGCVRAKDAVEGFDASLDAMRDALDAHCRRIFRFPRFIVPCWTGVGGTVTTLAALFAGLTEYDREAVERVALTQEAVETLARSLFDAGDCARREIPLLHDRHDVIIPGALLLLYIMRGMGIYSLAVSDSDGMEGYLRAQE